MKSLVEWIKKYGYIALIILLAIIALANIITRSPVYTLLEKGESVGSVSPILGNGTATQIIEGYEGQLYGIYLSPATHGANLQTGVLQIAVLDIHGNELFSTAINGSDIVDNKELYIPIESTELDNGQTVTLQLSGKDFDEEDKLSFWLGDSDLAPFSIGEEKAEGPILIKLEQRVYQSRWQRGYPFMVLAIALLACWPLTKKHEENVAYEKAT